MVWVPSLRAQTADCPAAPLLAERDFRADLGIHACAFSDPARRLTLTEAIAQAGALFQPVPGGLVDFGFGASRYWVLVHLQNMSDQPGTWWVTHDIPVAETLNVHLLPHQGDAASARSLLALTDRDSFRARPIQHRHLASEIILQPQQSATLVIDYTSAQATEMPLFIESVPRFVRRTQAETAEITSLIALVLGMGLISTIYLYGLEGSPAFAYGSYVLSGVALLVHMEGLTFQYVWPNSPGVNQIALPVIAPLSVALGIFFVDKFTQTRRHLPRLHLIAVALIAALALLALFAAPLVALVWFKIAVLITVLLGTTLQVVLAVTAWRRGQSGASLLVLGFGLLAASFSLGVVGYLTEGLFEQELAGRAIRFGFLFEAAAFSAAIALRVRAARRERDASLREQLRLSEDRLNLSEALRKAEDDRQRAANAAVRSQQALASTAHDIRQPLASLQMALANDDAMPEHVAKSLEYLENIVRSGLEENSIPLGTGDADPPSRNACERFRADIVLKNIHAMFADEATGQGTALKVVDCSAYLVANPLALMRMIGNLVSNALQHGKPTRIVVGCRRDPAGLRFEVHDDGRGMTDADLVRIHERGQKGAGSDGHGLGLAIVSELERENGLRFDIASKPGRGTLARVTVPVSATVRRSSPSRQVGEYT